MNRSAELKCLNDSVELICKTCCLIRRVRGFENIFKNNIIIDSFLNVWNNKTTKYDITYNLNGKLPQINKNNQTFYYKMKH